MQFEVTVNQVLVQSHLANSSGLVLFMLCIFCWLTMYGFCLSRLLSFTFSLVQQPQQSEPNGLVTAQNPRAGTERAGTGIRDPGKEQNCECGQQYLLQLGFNMKNLAGT